MSYSNDFLCDFRPVFFGILKERRVRPERVELEVIDEEPQGESMFEPIGVREVLEQISEDLNFLTIYTERPAYFQEFAETMYQENGLVVMIFPKEKLTEQTKRYKGMRAPHMAVNGRREEVWRLILDFEWEGSCYTGQMSSGRHYIPIHKKPWKLGDNLDIIVPIGYNTVIVKGIQNQRKKPGRDRFEEAFYSL